MKVDLRSEIEIQELQAWMDGGTVTLICKNKKEQKFEIEFVQNVVWEVPHFLKLPGRIYLNDELVDQRSELENLIIQGLEAPNFTAPEKLDLKILKEKLYYVKSEAYLTDVAKVKLCQRRKCT